MSIQLGELCPGMTVRRTSKGYYAVSIEHFADPDKRDPSFLEKAREASQDDGEFRKEYLLDWTVSRGEAFYPEFARYKDSMVRHIPGLLRGPVIRGWDFGQRHPACTWLQLSPKNNIVLALREFMPSNIGTHNHRDIVMFLSGQIPRSALSERAEEELCRVLKLYRYPEPPWFDAGTEFVDFSSHEMMMLDANARDEDEEKSARDICLAKGINIRLWAGEIGDRVNVLRLLMRKREDGTFGFYVDPSCVLIVRGLSGGLQYAKPTANDPYPTRPAKSIYLHLHDALGYGVVNMVSVRDANPARRGTTQPSERPLEPGRDLGRPRLVRHSGGSYESRRGRR